MRVISIGISLLLSLIGCNGSEKVTQNSSDSVGLTKPNTSVKSVLLLNEVTVQNVDSYTDSLKSNLPIKSIPLIDSALKRDKVTNDKLIVDKLIIDADFDLALSTSSIFDVNLYQSSMLDTGPVMRIKSDGPVKTENVKFYYDNGDMGSQTIFTNNFNVIFLGNKDNIHEIRLNLSEDNNIKIKSPYSDDLITIAEISSKGRSILHPDSYTWLSCIYIYHKELNRAISLFPEGSIMESPIRSLKSDDTYEREEVFIKNVEEDNGVYMIQMTSVSRLRDKTLDASKEKLLTYTFKFNTHDEQYPIDIFGCDYRFVKNDKLVYEPECEFSISN